jgi:hypothetical protein
MRIKRKSFWFITFYLLTSLCLSFAQTEDKITITTYYPSPYGSYNEMGVFKRQAIGDLNNDGKTDAQDMAVDNFGNPLPGTLTVAERVGIGTKGPINRLDVRSSPSDNIISAVETTSNKGVWIGHDGIRGIIRTTYDPVGSFSPLTLQTSNTDRVYITTDGNVVIGTTMEPTPSVTKLVVEASAPFNTIAARSGSDTAGYGGKVIIENTDFPNDDQQWILTQHRGGNFAIHHSKVGDRMTFNRNGNVGIGTTDPTHRLEVNGTAYVGALKIETLVEAAGAAQDVCRNPSTVPESQFPFYLSGCSPSTKKHKNNIQDLPPGLKTVTDLRPVVFNWKGDNSRDLGLIAEEVFEVEPLLVTYDDEGKPSGVKYKQLTAVLINAVKELKKESDDLKKRIEVLENKKDAGY